jgi:hypothetical protein
VREQFEERLRVINDAGNQIELLVDELHQLNSDGSSLRWFAVASTL